MHTIVHTHDTHTIYCMYCTLRHYTLHCTHTTLHYTTHTHHLLLLITPYLHITHVATFSIFPLIIVRQDTYYATLEFIPITCDFLQITSTIRLHLTQYSSEPLPKSFCIWKVTKAVIHTCGYS